MSKNEYSCIMVRLLHIETATKVCSVAISENGQLKDVVEEHSDKYIHSEKLTLFIEEILQKNQWNLKALNAVVVTSGPGSYTGLRIGVSTAKGLCYALGIPLISVGAIESIAYLATQKYPHQNICALIDARRMEVFSSIYNSAFELVKPLSADVIETTSYQEFEPFIVCGDGAEKLQEVWENRALHFDLEILSSAKGQIQLAYQKYQEEKFEDVAYFEPKYLKDFVVTMKKH